jgi:hypothetical protein
MNYAPKDIVRYTTAGTNVAMVSGEVLTQTIQWASRIPMVEDMGKSKGEGPLDHHVLGGLGSNAQSRAFGKRQLGARDPASQQASAPSV